LKGRLRDMMKDNKMGTIDITEMDTRTIIIAKIINIIIENIIPVIIKIIIIKITN